MKYKETCTYKQYMYNNQGNCYFYVYSCNRDYGTSNYTYTYQTDYDCYQPVEYCRVQFSDNVMNDVIQNTPVLTSAIFNTDNYSDFISKGEYEDVSKILVNSIKNKVDSIVIDKGVRLQVYSGKNYSGDLLIDVVGPMIINNAIYENNVLQQINYFDKTFQDVYTHNLFPPSTRKINDPSFLLNNIVNGSMKISCNNKDTDNKNIGVKGRITIPQDNCRVHFATTLISDNQQSGVFSKAFVSDNYSDIISIGEYSDNSKILIKSSPNSLDSVDGIAVDSGVRLQIYKNKDFTGGVILDVVGPILINNFIHKDTFLKKENYFNKTFSDDLQSKFPSSKRTISSFDLRTINLGSSKITCFNDPNDSLNIGVSFYKEENITETIIGDANSSNFIVLSFDISNNTDVIAVLGVYVYPNLGGYDYRVRIYEAIDNWSSFEEIKIEGSYIPYTTTTNSYGYTFEVSRSAMRISAQPFYRQQKSVSISDDGKIVTVGYAYGLSYTDTVYGRAYKCKAGVAVLKKENSWSIVQNIYHPINSSNNDPYSWKLFGETLSLSGNGKHLSIVDPLEKVSYIENGVKVDDIMGATYYYEYDEVGQKFVYKNRIIIDRAFMIDAFKRNSLDSNNNITLIDSVKVMDSIVISNDGNMIISTININVGGSYFGPRYIDNTKGVMGVVYTKQNNNWILSGILKDDSLISKDAVMNNITFKNSGSFPSYYKLSSVDISNDNNTIAILYSYYPNADWASNTTYKNALGGISFTFKKNNADWVVNKKYDFTNLLSIDDYTYKSTDVTNFNKGMFNYMNSFPYGITISGDGTNVIYGKASHQLLSVYDFDNTTNYVSRYQTIEKSQDFVYGLVVKTNHTGNVVVILNNVSSVKIIDKRN